ncbi:MAG: MMPL family transporter [Actinomycetaceae bacterium]|nr:MMPL family transporter [Actinomycetaceae bacterium]
MPAHGNTSEAPVGRIEKILTAIARWSIRYRRSVLVVTALVTVVSAIVAAGALSALQLARFEVPGSPSVEAAEQLAQRGTGRPNLTLLVRPAQGKTLGDPEVKEAAGQIEETLRSTAGVEDVFSYWSAGEWALLAADNGESALIMARLVGDPTRTRTLLDSLSPELDGNHGAIEIQVGGSEEVFRQAADQARADFVRAEAIIIPGVFLLLLLILRRFAAAATTLALGIVSVIGSLAIVRGLAAIVEMSTFAANLVLIMGIALGVDYGFFVIARYREARAEGISLTEAPVEALRGAGHTVVVSAAAVVVALASMVLLPFSFLRSLAYAGMAVVVVATLLAIIVMPALLAVVGRWVDSRVVRDPQHEGIFGRAARATMKHPVIYLVLGIAVVTVFAAPLTGIRIGPPDDRILPPDATSRVVTQTLRDTYSADVDDMLLVINREGGSAPGSGHGGDEGAIATYSQRLAQIPGVAQVVEPVQQGVPVDVTRIIVPTEERMETDPYGLVAEVRQIPPPEGMVVGGYPAELADYRQALAERLPLVLLTLLVASTVVLIAATRTIVLPLKAAALNVASLSILGGVMVFVFQEGNFASLIGVTPTGTLDLSIPILMTCLAFGLSMDYEVLLILRIFDEHRKGKNLDDSVAIGLDRSAPLVTAAAGILAASFLVYLTSSIAYLKMLAIGMALVIALDATLLRLVLLPTAMKVMGEANWWWPGKKVR